MSNSKVSDYFAESCPDSGSEYVVEEESLSSGEENVPPPNVAKRNNTIKKISNFFVINRATPQSKTDRIATCTLCKTKKTTLKMKNGATTSLKRHLQSKHKHVYEQTFPQDNEKTIDVNTSSTSVLRWLENRINCGSACSTVSVSFNCM